MTYMIDSQGTTRMSMRNSSLRSVVCGGHVGSAEWTLLPPPGGVLAPTSFSIAARNREMLWEEKEK